MTNLRNNGKNEIEQAIDEAGGGEQRVRLLGPFHVAHDDTNVGDDVHVITSSVIPAGCSVVSAWFITTEAFAPSSNEHEALIGVMIDGNPFYVSIYTGWSGQNPYSDPSNAGIEITRNVVTPPAVTTLACEFYSGGTAFTTGEVDIYVLIAEPVE